MTTMAVDRQVGSDCRWLMVSDEPGLLVQRVGVACVTVLVGRGLEVRDRGQVARVGGGPEVGGVVLVVGLVAVADHAPPTSAAGASGWRSRRSTRTARGAGCSRSRLAAHVLVASASRSAPWSAGCAVSGHVAIVEAALEPAPGDLGGGQLLADVVAAHGDRVGRGVAVAAVGAGQVGADVVGRVGVAVRGAGTRAGWSAWARLVMLRGGRIRRVQARRRRARRSR